MNWKIVFIGGVAYYVTMFLVSFATGYFIHCPEGVLGATYRATASFWRPEFNSDPPDMAALMKMWIATGLASALVAAGIYSVVRASLAGAAWQRGLKFGVIAALFAVISAIGYRGRSQPAGRDLDLVDHGRGHPAPGRRHRARHRRAEDRPRERLTLAKARPHMTLAALDARFPNRRAVITGGASGLGLAAAELLAARGWKIALLDRDEPRLASAAEALRALGSPHCEAFAVDTTDEAAVKFAVDAFAGRLGGIDLAINSAGVAAAGSLDETPSADWRWILEINVLGVVHSCRAEVPHMVAAGRGLIVNVASAAAFMSAPAMGAYNASKAAVAALSETLYHDSRRTAYRSPSRCPGSSGQTHGACARRGGCPRIRRAADGSLEHGGERHRG